MKIDRTGSFFQFLNTAQFLGAMTSGSRDVRTCLSWLGRGQVAGLLLLLSCAATAWSADPLGAVFPDGAQEVPGWDQACWDHVAVRHSMRGETLNRSLSDEIHEFQPLVEKSLAYRAETIKVADRLKRQIKAGKPLSGQDLDTLNTGVVAHLELRKKLYETAEAHECWLDTSSKILEGLGLSPEDRLKGVMLSLSAALTLYDNYLLAISLYEEDTKLRQFLNRRDSGYAIGRAELAKVTAQYNSLTNRNRIRAGMRYYSKELKRLGPRLLDDPSAAYLSLLIEQSPSYSSLQGLAPLKVFARNLGFLGAATQDTLKSLGEEGVNLFSMLFGNTVGLVESRKGKLFNRPEVVQTVKAKLRAGDILLEKTPFRLTDKLIPGFWGHVAVWIGTEEELRALRVWDDPVVRKFHDRIRKGMGVVEALRSGVELNPLEKFLNIDDMAALRDQVLDDDARGKLVIRALRQVGKGYDFNFDVETTDRIVCSELVYVVHTRIEWPTQRTLGRATISPDNVAAKAASGNPLRVTALYLDGQEVADGLTDRFAALVAGAR